MTSALNPNHPVTQEFEELWHKVAALMMFKHGETEVVIRSQDINDFGCADMCIVVYPIDRVLNVRLVTRAEGERLAREAGGLPQ